MLITANGKRIMIFVGEFGSGKTELAIAQALGLAAAGHSTAVVDIDLVKPFFRTRENRKLLEAGGVYVVAAEARLAHSDLPIMPEGLTRVLYDQTCHVVMDVGGGESAIVLGQLRNHLEANEYDAIMVVNTCRPFTADSDGIVKTMRRIELVSRLKISALLANPNVAAETTTQVVLDGAEIVKTAADRLGLPMCGLVAPEWLKGQLEVTYPVFWLKPSTRYPWME